MGPRLECCSEGFAVGQDLRNVAVAQVSGYKIGLQVEGRAEPAVIQASSYSGYMRERPE